MSGHADFFGTRLIITLHSIYFADAFMESDVQLRGQGQPLNCVFVWASGLGHYACDGKVAGSNPSIGRMMSPSHH